MSSVSSVIEIAVSKFIANTCEDHPRPNFHRVVGLFRLFDRAKRGGTDVSNITVRTLTGSRSEFFIDPMLPCVNDTDIMVYTSEQLVVSSRHHVPRYGQLPAEFHSSEEIELYEFVDIPIPCYVYIRFIGKLRKCDTNDTYMFVPATDEYDYLELKVPSTQHGPARTLQDALTLDVSIAGRRHTTQFSHDNV